MTIPMSKRHFLLVGIGFHGSACDASDHSIRIEMKSTVYAMLDPLTVYVTFQNDGKTEWSVFRPDQSPFTLLECLPLNNRHNPGVGYFFGKLDYHKTVIPGKAIIESIGMPKHVPLKIPPGGTIDFRPRSTIPSCSAVWSAHGGSW